jgi:alkaline phosphatase D
MRRRHFLERTLAAPAILAAWRAARGAPAIVRAEGSRPLVAQGAAVGDVVPGRAIVWSRADRPARLVVEWDTADSFRNARRVTGQVASEATGLTARLDLTGLPAGQRIVYRARFQDLADARAWSEPVGGSFRTPSLAAADVTVAWSADTVGQGWGINPEWGGLRLYETMRRAAPDVFIHCGDTVYADGPLLPEVKLDDGTIWRNLVTPAKSKPAESLEDFRGCHLYNLSDDNLRRFNAEVPTVALWDDHEVLDNWYPTEILSAQDRHVEKRVSVLAGHAKQAFYEHYPIRATPAESERVYRTIPYGPSVEIFCLDMRTYRGANSPNRQAALGPNAAFLGPAQCAWLKSALRASRATWKVIAADQPLSLVVTDGPTDYEAVANADPGAPLGRELEIADVLSFVKRERIRNLVWVTGDVHYAAAHHYDPARARFTDFDPFWEFVAGPLHAGTFGPNVLDPTFGPEVRFTGIPPGMKPNRPPSDGFQFFGTMKVDGRTQVMTVQLRDVSGKTLYSVDLPPRA